MATEASKAPAEIRYIISYDVRDGDNEYQVDCSACFDHEPTEEEQVLAVIENYAHQKKDIDAALQEWKRDGRCFEMPNDYRIIEDVGIDRAKTAFPILLDALQAAFVYMSENNQDSTGDRLEIFEQVQVALAVAEGRA